MRTRRSPRNQESMLHIVSGIKDKQALIMNNSKQRERIAELEAENAALLDRISAEAGLRVDAEAERDAARAWAAAWKRAAKWWWLASRDATARGVMNAWWRKESSDRRAAEAAEAMERR